MLSIIYYYLYIYSIIISYYLYIRNIYSQVYSIIKIIGRTKSNISETVSFNMNILYVCNVLYFYTQNLLY